MHIGRDCRREAGRGVAGPKPGAEMSAREREEQDVAQYAGYGERRRRAAAAPAPGAQCGVVRAPPPP